MTTFTVQSLGSTSQYSKDAILETIVDGNVVNANPEACRIFGRTLEEFRQLGRAGVVDMADPRLPGLLQERAEKGSAFGELTFIRSDGTHFPGEISSTIYTASDGLKYTSMIIRDVSARKEAENALNVLNQTLEERVERRTHELVVLNNEKNEFLGIAAHDLKNPLAGILTSAGILERYYSDNIDIKRFVGMIINASNQMLEIITNLLDFNKIESGMMKLNIKPVSLEILDGIVEDYQNRAAQKGIILHYQSPERDSVRVHADAQAVKQIFDNLISNAIKYSPQWKNVWVHINSTEEQGERFIRIEVQDEGPGLSEADKQQLFQKFARLSAQPTGGENSTGLGLSIVKKLVDLQHGRVWCESVLGKGTTFIVEFPGA